MLYIKNFNRFIKEEMSQDGETSQDGEISKGEILQFQLRDFNTKKENLRKLIISNIDTDKDIEKNYEDIVGENPFLHHLGNLLRVEADILRKENKLKEMDDTLSKYEEDMKLVDKLSDESEKEQQIKNLEEQIEENKTESEKDKQTIEELKEKHSGLEEELQQIINQKGSELRDIEKSASVYESTWLDIDEVEQEFMDSNKKNTLEDLNRIKSKVEEANQIWEYLFNNEKKKILKKFNIESKFVSDISSLPYNKIESVSDYVLKMEFEDGDEE